MKRMLCLCALLSTIFFLNGCRENGVGPATSQGNGVSVSDTLSKHGMGYGVADTLSNGRGDVKPKLPEPQNESEAAVQENSGQRGNARVTTQ